MEEKINQDPNSPINQELNYWGMLDLLVEGVQIHDFDWKYIFVNDALVKYSSFTKEELLGYTIMEKYPGIEHTELFKTLERCMHSRIPDHLETEFVFPDGSIGFFELRLKPIPEGILILSIDRTEQKKAKDKLVKVNRLYAFTSAINQSIVHYTDEQELLQKICQISNDIGQFKLTWISLIEDDQRLKIVAIGGNNADANKILKTKGIAINDPILDIIPTGKALRTGTYAFHNDVQNEPAFISHREEFVRQGIYSSMALPIFSFGKVIGIMGLHAPSKDFFDTDEINLLQEAAGDISFALENFEKAKRHKESEDRLVKYEKRFRALIEKSVDMKTLSTEEGILMYGSPSVTKVLGYHLTEFLHRPASDFIHPDDIPHLKLNREKLILEAGKSFEFQYRFLHKDGRWLWCEGALTNMLHVPGVQAFVSNFRDVSEKKKAQEELIKSEVFNRGVLNSLSAHIAVVNEEGVIVAANEAWNRFAIENGEVNLRSTGKGSNYFNVCKQSAANGDEMAEFVLEGMKEVMENRIPVFYFEYPCHSPTEQRWYAMRVLKFEGDSQMIVVAHQDITERKLAEDKIVLQNEELQKTNEELDRFVYSASHDLRSPLTSVLGLVSFIEDESKEESTLEYAKMIRSSIDRLDGFIKNILNYSRNNRSGLQVDEIPVGRIITEIIESLVHMKEAEGISFEVAIHEPHPFYSDRQRFSTLLENLISNAIKYHKKDILGRYIKLTGEVHPDRLCIRIEDNGIGIAPHYHAKIFDMFFRLASPVAGTGIGLYIVKEIVKKLQGTIEITSEEGKGTTFTIKLINLIPQENLN